MKRSSALLAILLALSGASTQAATCKLQSQGPAPKGTLSLKATPWVTGLEVPWSIAFLPGQGLTALVTERPGRLRLIRNGKLEKQPILNLIVALSGEAGLLGVALHPDFKTNRWFYLYSTITEGEETFNRVRRYQLSEDFRTAAEQNIVFDKIPGAIFHDGGRLRIGPDGLLYVGTGDARTPKLAQDRKSLAGKVLRVNPDGTVPTNNPIQGSPVYLTGVRNPQGLSWLPTGELLVADHGPSGELGLTGRDELSVAHAGENLGWPKITACETKTGMITPAIAWSQAMPPGGVLYYTSNKISSLARSVLVTSLGARALWRLVLGPRDEVTTQEVYFSGDAPDGFGRLRDIVEGPDGLIYITTSNCDGRADCPAAKDMVLRVSAE